MAPLLRSPLESRIEELRGAISLPVDAKCKKLLFLTGMSTVEKDLKPASILTVNYKDSPLYDPATQQLYGQGFDEFGMMLRSGTSYSQAIASEMAASIERYATGVRLPHARPKLTEIDMTLPVAASAAVLLDLAMARQKRDDHVIGRLLGYPESALASTKTIDALAFWRAMQDRYHDAERLPEALLYLDFIPRVEAGVIDPTNLHVGERHRRRIELVDQVLGTRLDEEYLGFRRREIRNAWWR